MYVFSESFLAHLESSPAQLRVSVQLCKQDVIIKVLKKRIRRNQIHTLSASVKRQLSLGCIYGKKTT
jgi:hypothetical protein